jgi:hypothetical protein
MWALVPTSDGQPIRVQTFPTREAAIDEAVSDAIRHDVVGQNPNRYVSVAEIRAALEQTGRYRDGKDWVVVLPVTQ